MKTLKTLITVSILFIIPVAIWSQNVGIGTTTPDSKLTVVDSVRNTINIKTLDNLKSTGIAFQNSDSSYAWNIFRSPNGTNTSDFIIAGGVTNNDLSNLAQRFKISKAGNTTIYGTTTLDSTTTVNRSFITNGGPSIFNENGTPTSFRIESNNNQNMFYVNGNTNSIGIGTPNPSAQLDIIGSLEVNGNSLFNANGSFHDFKIKSQNNPQMFFVNAIQNKIGIGTTLPSAELDIVGDLEVNGTSVFNEIGGNHDFRIESNNNENMFYVNGNTNNIGIGTPYPSAQLDIIGSLEVNGTSVFNDNSTTSSLRVKSETNPYMFFVNGGTNKIGIGTSSPTAELDIVGSLEVNGASVFNEDGNSDDFRVKSNNNSSMLFVNGSTNRVGIGTSNPSTELDIIGGVRVIGASVFNDFSQAYDFRVKSNTNQNMFFVDGTNDAIGIGTATPSAELDIVGGLEVNGATNLNGIINTYNGNLNTHSGHVIFNQDGGLYNFRVESNTNENMLFVDGGSNKIGIGTSTPGSTLDIVGNLEVNGDLRVKSSSGSNLFFVDDSSYKIGVNTNSPSALLDINGSFEVQGDSELKGDLITRNGFVVFNQDGDNYNFRVESKNNSQMFFVDGFQDKIGIGTITPSAELDIEGDLEVNGDLEVIGKLTTNNGDIIVNQNSGDYNFRIKTLGKTNMFFVNGNNDKIGIGTAVPSAELDIEGDLEVNGKVDLHHGVVNGSGDWPIKFHHDTVSNFLGGLRITNSGYLEMTNNANLLSPNKARLNSSGSWSAVSDRRLKKNISKANDLLAKTLQLKPVNYVFKSDENEINQLGFIAQDVQKVFPEFIEEGELLTLNYAGLSVVAIGAIKELNEKNNVLESRISELEAANDKLVSQVSDLTNMKEQIKKELLSEMSQNSVDNDTASKE